MNNSDSEKKNNFVRSPIQSLHTLDADILSSMKDENYASNIVKVLTHNTEKKDTIEQDSNLVKNTQKKESFFSFIQTLNSTYVYVGLSIFLFGTLGGVTYYVVKTSIENTVPKPDPVTVATSTKDTASSTLPDNISITQKNIFNAEVLVPIEIEKLTKPQIISLIRDTKKELVQKEIRNNINISLSTGISLQDLFNKIQYSGPDTLTRSLVSDKIYTVGLYHKAKGDFEMYILTKIDIFDLAFAGMLEWERFMPVDLYNLYSYNSTVVTSSTVSTSSPTISKKEASTNGIFIDTVIKNIDVRTYIDPIKGTRIVYGFINKEYLLITSGESSFIDIVNKLTINNILR